MKNNIHSNDHICQVTHQFGAEEEDKTFQMSYCKKESSVSSFSSGNSSSAGSYNSKTEFCSHSSSSNQYSASGESGIFSLNSSKTLDDEEMYKLNASIANSAHVCGQSTFKGNTKKVSSSSANSEARSFSSRFADGFQKDFYSENVSEIPSHFHEQQNEFSSDSVGDYKEVFSHNNNSQVIKCNQLNAMNLCKTEMIEQENANGYFAKSHFV